MGGVPASLEALRSSRPTIHFMIVIETAHNFTGVSTEDSWHQAPASHAGRGQDRASGAGQVLRVAQRRAEGALQHHGPAAGVTSNQ